MVQQYANAPQKQLSVGVDNVSTSITLDSLTGLPSTFPYTLVLDPGTSLEEAVDVTANPGGTTLTVARGVDSTTAVAHATGAKANHSHIARDSRNFEIHRTSTTGVHGATGSLVDTGSSQTITGDKTFSGALATASGAVVSVGGAQTITGDKTFSGLLTTAANGAVLTAGAAQTITGAKVFTGDVTLPATVNTPRGVVAYSRQTIDSGFSTGSGFSVAVLGIAYTFVAGRRYRIKGVVHSLAETANGSTIAALHNITDGSGASNSHTPGANAPTTSVVTHTVEDIYEPASTLARTWQVWLTSSSGRVKMDNGTGFVSFIEVIDEGEV